MIQTFVMYIYHKVVEGKSMYVSEGWSCLSQNQLLPTYLVPGISHEHAHALNAEKSPESLDESRVV